MGKKEKAVASLVEDFQAMIKMVPKLESFIKVYNDIAAGYQKYRKNGGDAIPGIEKHLGIKIQDAASQPKVKKSGEKSKTKVKPETKTPKETTAAPKAKKKAKK
jgi:hypothetical protein